MDRVVSSICIKVSHKNEKVYEKCNINIFIFVNWTYVIKLDNVTKKILAV